MKQLFFTRGFSSARPSQILGKVLPLSAAAFASLATASASGAPVDSRDRLQSTAPGEVVTYDNDVRTYLGAHPEDPFNGNSFYRFPDGHADTALSQQQRQIFAIGLHAEVPNGPAGDAFIARMKAKYKKIVVTQPRAESLSLSSFYTITGNNILFALDKDSQKPDCQPEPGPTELNARVTANTGFVPEGDKAHMMAIPLQPGLKGYAKGAITFGRSFRARVDAGTLVVANGNSHVEMIARTEMIVSRQIMLAADRHNLKTFKSCIKNTYEEPGCITLEGTPDEPGAPTGTAIITITNNKKDCFARSVSSGSQPGGAGGPGPLETSSISDDLSAAAFPELDTGNNVSGGGSGGYYGSRYSYGGESPTWYPVGVAAPSGGPGTGTGGGTTPPVGPAPEPATWAEILAGVGIAGFALRRYKVIFAPN